jgi:hypothetical protein
MKTPIPELRSFFVNDVDASYHFSQETIVLFEGAILTLNSRKGIYPGDSFVHRDRNVNNWNLYTCEKKSFTTIHITKLSKSLSEFGGIEKYKLMTKT